MMLMMIIVRLGLLTSCPQTTNHKPPPDASEAEAAEATQGIQVQGVDDANDYNSKIGTSHFMSKVKIKSKIKLKSKFKSPLNINSSHNNELKTTLMTRSQPNAAAKAIINTNPNHSPPPDASEAEAA